MGQRALRTPCLLLFGDDPHLLARHACDLRSPPDRSSDTHPSADSRAEPIQRRLKFLIRTKSLSPRARSEVESLVLEVARPNLLGERKEDLFDHGHCRPPPSTACKRVQPSRGSLLAPWM